MYFDDLNDVLVVDTKISAEIITSVSVRKIYYLVTGRNAWHSTWVQHFYKKCISTEFRELEIDAEKRREAGTVFYIEELPALCLDVSSGCFALTEINTHYPLKNYNPKKFLSSRNQCNFMKENDCPSEKIFVGNSLSSVVISLGSSECWTYPSRGNSMFKLFLSGKDSSLLDDQTYYYSIKSSGSSGGKKNSLSWVLKTGKVTDAHINKIVGK